MRAEHEAASFAVGFCGGSGLAYGLRLVRALLEAGGTVHLCATPAALRVARTEAGLDVTAVDGFAQVFPDALQDRLRCHDIAAVDAAPASGSAALAATVLCPCSMGTLARVAHGFSTNLVERAADVALKEKRKLIVVPRETPLSTVHLRNMVLLAEAGAVVLPAMPGFYHRPRTVDDLIDFVVGKVLDQLGVRHPLVRRWQGPPAASPWDEGES
jgi:4-hydroxy-3-polyprenylbenzoate decarboxylase